MRQCLIDEVQVTTPTLRAALEQVARFCAEEPFLIPEEARIEQVPPLIRIRRGKYGTLLQQVTEDSYLSGRNNWEDYSTALAFLAFEEQFRSTTNAQIFTPVANSLLKAIELGERKDKVCAASVCMVLAFLSSHQGIPSEPVESELFLPLRNAICEMLFLNDPPLALAATWALAWIGANRICNSGLKPVSMLCLYQIWRESPSNELSLFAAWAFAVQPLLPRDTFGKNVWGSCDEFLQKVGVEEIQDRWSLRFSQKAALVVAYYRGAPWRDEDLLG